MKMVKSLLLGSAAGLVAIAGAQAADLPVKAKPVQYVKICSLYGAGFYYIPGTDTCIKIGGWVRLYTIYGGNGDSTNGALNDKNYYNRNSNDFSWKQRGYITADARTQSEYGTLRAYLDVGFTGDSPGSLMSFSSNRAFIQFAGFTFGLAQSFYDFYNQSAVSYWGGRITPNSDTGDAGQTVWAYTGQFGNGLSASLSAEAPNVNRRTFIWNGNSLAFPASSSPTGNTGYAGDQWPDFVANLRMDAGWGAVQVMGAVHDVTAPYYGATEGTGHPSDAVGFAVGAGVKINFPTIGAGDYFQAQVNYTQGATGYVAVPSANTTGWGMYKGNSYGYGLQADAVYGGTIAAGTATDLQLTTAWGVAASYEHFWSKKWQTSVYGSYAQFEYNSTANTLMCGATVVVSGTCDNNFSVWDIGTRTQFNLDANTYVGLDVFYQNLNSASAGAVYTLAPGNGKPAGNYQISDQSAWVAEFRVHRNFYP